MPIADFLGMRFDMQLLGKLTLSMATVLFISWVYRYYSSRAQGQGQDDRTISSPSSQSSSSPKICSGCKVDLRHRKMTSKETSGEETRTKQSLGSTISAHTPEIHDLETTLENQLTRKEFATMDIKTLAQQEVLAISKISDKDQMSTVEDASKQKMTLSVDHASETGSAIKTGRRSPCMLRKLDGAVSVGRELRRDVGHQGNFSSFQSKAEVKMEDTKLVLGGADEPKVHGKIYEYYVESSSQSFPCIESISRPKRLTCGGSMTLKPQHVTAVGSSNNDYPRSPTSTLIMQDLALSQDSAEDAHSPVSPEPTSFSEPIRGLIRKDSYLTAAKNSVSEHAPVRHTMPGKNTSSPRETNEPSLETVAGAKFVHFPPENLGSYSLDNLKGKLHLGNCLEALSLAKMHGHASLQQACLRVMSDNYLQVLRDPGLYGRLMAGEREQIQKLRMKGKKCLMVADMDSPDWSRHQSRTKDPSNPNASSGLYYYDDYKDTWHLQCDIPQEVLSVGSAVCTMDNYLFVAVGCQRSDRDSVPSRRVFSYNPMTSIWNEICPMNEARPHCKLVALQGYVYAIGGECLSTVERYDPRTNRWLFVAPLPNDTFAVAHRATACNGELFVSGGTLRYTLLRYSPKTNTWRKSLIVGTKERTTEMVAVRNFLYRFDVSPSFGINVYRYHTVARLWYECCAKRLAHCPAFQCVTMDEVIYCVSRQFTMRFLADEVSPCFVAEDLSVLVTAKGILFPFVLTLPEESTLQTSV